MLAVRFGDRNGGFSCAVGIFFLSLSFVCVCDTVLTVERGVGRRSEMKRSPPPDHSGRSAERNRQVGP